VSDPIITVEGVRRSFGDVHALDGVDLHVDQGTVLGLLGPNGAGKTTLVRVLTTLLAPDAGRATVAGFDVVDDAQLLRKHIGLAGQYAAVDEDLTGRENLELVGRLYHLGRAEAERRAADVLERIHLTDAADRPARTYSGGMRRRLDLAASLVGRPTVLFLDEPTTGLDPRSRLDLWGLIEELVADGTTLLLTTQYLEEADQLADRIAVIDRGTIIARGTSDELKRELGGDVLHVRAEDRDHAGKVLEALGRHGQGDPHTDEDTGEAAVSVADGPTALTRVVRELDDAGIALADIGLRRPSLDEVFLALTGQVTEADEDPTATRSARRRRSRR
jgi:ABC-2 type transport system ATP-binding protein